MVTPSIYSVVLTSLKNYCTRSFKLLSRANDYDNCTQPNTAYFALAPYTALTHILSTTTRSLVVATGWNTKWQWGRRGIPVFSMCWQVATTLLTLHCSTVWALLSACLLNRLYMPLESIPAELHGSVVLDMINLVLLKQFVIRTMYHLPAIASFTLRFPILGAFDWCTTYTTLTFTLKEKGHSSP